MNSLQKDRIKMLLIPALLCTGIIAFAQNSEKEVMKPIHLLFEGMLKADTNIVKQVFVENVKMVTGFKSRDGEEVVSIQNLDDMIYAIAKKEAGSPNWIEKLFNTEIKIDDNIAQVWTEYSFFVGDKFSHCGVDAFQLVKIDNKWKIIHIMDTRRKEGCKDFLPKD